MMTQQRTNFVVCWAMMVVVMSACFVSLAHASTQVNFHGTLIDNPPCDITGENDPIYVDFDEVGITKIDGINYMKDFTLTVTCGADLGNNVALYMGYNGMNAPFDDDAVQTNLRGLGIRLYYQGHVIPPNDDDIPVAMSSGVSRIIELSAVPVKDTSIDLLEGPFTAVGTVEIRYP